MHMRDTTMEANSGEDMQSFYLYHSQSPGDRWALAVEQPETTRFNVSVLYKEPAWDLFGAIRYWVFPERALAEARYLELQKLFEGFEEAIALREMTRILPPVERHWGEEAESEAEAE